MVRDCVQNALKLTSKVKSSLAFLSRFEVNREKETGIVKTIAGGRKSRGMERRKGTTTEKIPYHQKLLDWSLDNGKDHL
jgi:hypothetical protein